MSSLIENFNSEYTAEANILTNRSKLVVALVEDEYDIPFWNDLLNNNNSNIYFEFTPFYSNLGLEHTTKGKKHLLKLHQNLGANLIICVDSDYDYLLPSLTEEARVMNNSRYILQTYVYSIENYNCHASTLNKVCSNSAKQSINYNFTDFLVEYSHIIYPLLLWSLLLESKEFGLERTLPRTKAAEYMMKNCSIVKVGQDSLLKRIKKSVSNKIIDLEKNFPEEIENLNIIKTELTIKGLTPNNAYLFIRGHDLQNFLISNILEPIRLDAFKRHIRDINNLNTNAKEKENQKKRFKNIQQSITSLIGSNFEYKLSCSIFENHLKPNISTLFQDLENSAM